MPISTRMDKETEDVMKRAAECLNLTRSEIVRKSVKEYCMKIIEERQNTPWETYQAIHTSGGSGHGKRVLRRKEILKDKLEAKRKKWSL